MGDQRATTSDQTIVVLSGAWAHASGHGGGETAFTTRAVAGALSRFGSVEVVVAADPRGGGVASSTAATTIADGLFDLRVVTAAGAGTTGWPEPGRAVLPDVGRPVLALVEEGDTGALGIARHALPGIPVVAVGSAEPARFDGNGGSAGEPDAWLTLGPGAGDAGAGDASAAAGNGRSIDLFVPVNRLAALHPHNGIGFVDYLLVLTDRGGRGDRGAPTTPAAWLAGAFPTQHLVVVEGGSAAVWRGRALRGTITVDTRTDLWRLMAHARTTVDLRPGPLIARECVESLRFGTPVVVPAGTAAARLAGLGGGLWYRDVRELLGCVSAMADPSVRAKLGEQGRAVADERYGDARRFVSRVGAALASLGVSA